MTLNSSDEKPFAVAKLSRICGDQGLVQVMPNCHQFTLSLVSTVNRRTMKSPVGLRNRMLVISGLSLFGSAGKVLSA